MTKDYIIENQPIGKRLFRQFCACNSLYENQFKFLESIVGILIIKPSFKNDFMTWLSKKNIKIWKLWNKKGKIRISRRRQTKWNGSRNMLNIFKQRCKHKNKLWPSFYGITVGFFDYNICVFIVQKYSYHILLKTHLKPTQQLYSM